MSHSFSLISTLAIGFAIAWALGFLMERIKVPALVGYLLAGIIISPATPGFVGDVNIASELSEIGVMLLMFGVGLHFSLTDLIRVKNIACLLYTSHVLHDQPAHCYVAVEAFEHASCLQGFENNDRGSTG